MKSLSKPEGRQPPTGPLHSRGRRDEKLCLRFPPHNYPNPSPPLARAQYVTARSDISPEETPRSSYESVNLARPQGA